MDNGVNIQLLDTTLRDGGLGLEDSNLKGYSNFNYINQDIENIAKSLTKANIDIIELGSIEISNIDKTNFAIYQSIEEISKNIPPNRNKNSLYAALYRGPDTPIEQIPNWREGLCEIVRVIIRYSELKKSVEFCAELSKKGYKVCIQPMLTMRYSYAELDYLISSANNMNAYALYFVDSYGYMQKKDIEYYFKLYNSNLKSDINIGFHAHNNMNLAFSNVLNLIEIANGRNIIIDSCVLGLGQGAGNLQTEIITDYLNKIYSKNYQYDEVLKIAEIVEKFFNTNICGYSLTYLISAINKTAYKYSSELRYKYKFKYTEIHKILNNIPNNLRYRYTPENLEKLVELYKRTELK